eukprot:Phypoly_transcript_01232.p1 GENE.Phypoly_transcript_01232~~Phypoly_transcript_01232.p1  ORF type:complete len:1147 (-),score=157.12 Phypoly_transcript_01232:70-3510(-)
MQQVPERISFPDQEESILGYWDQIKAFETSLKLSEGKPEYSFYDGPPFATGLPHYGHLLAGTIKDVVTRYAHSTGHHVPRRFGWDCHGLPIEFEIDKLHGVKTREDVLKMGIPKYNAECRAIVMRYSKDWEVVVRRMGRWIDMQNNYKTMDLSYMESVWWVFKELHTKGLVYRGYKVMPYSTGCTTPLSNFEANMMYKDVNDVAVYVSFPLEGSEASLVAWTTTPWTLPSNLALCVNPEMDYVHFYDNQRKKEFIILEARLSALYKNPAKDIVIKAKLKGKELAGKKYTPLFNYFLKEKDNGAFTVLTDSYVTAESGTGVVHQAPAFGEDDYRVCAAAGIIQKGVPITCPIDANGRFTEEVPDFVNQYIKDADKNIVQKLKAEGRLVQSSTIVHSYPFCWRSDTPLIYRAIPSWFVAVETIRDRLVANNKLSRWVPDFVQEKRFHNWLVDARDWAVSRNRYWGTPLPLWMSDDGSEIVCVGSIDELEKLSGVRVTDLHRESIDHITITSQSGKVLRRVDEVFDCWFESGSMPYAQKHYPFENKEAFEKTFPADFIAEGIDQTRGWFYTLVVLATALFDKPPFKNLIANGLILAADGKKMSKRLKNYPDPTFVVNQYGADALRLYLINSPVVRAETLKFQEKGVRDVIKDVFLPWFNAYRFFVQNALRIGEANNTTFTYDAALSLTSTNVMDKWILAACHGLLKFIQQEMQAYRLYTVVPRLVTFIGQLTNWYVRLNRRRLKASNTDAQVALNILFEVLLALGKAMTPFTPFFTEYMYQNLRFALPEAQRQDSIHYEMFPEPRAEALNARIEEAVSRMQNVIELGRVSRDRRKLPVKTPLLELKVVHSDAQYLQDLETMKPYILEELNVRNLVVTSDTDQFVSLRGEPDRDRLGKRLRKDLAPVSQAIQAFTQEQLKELLTTGQIQVLSHVLTTEDIKIIRDFKGSSRYEHAFAESALTMLDCQVDDELRSEGLAREVINRVQKLRKKAGVNPGDPVEVFYAVGNVTDDKAPLSPATLSEALVAREAMIFAATKLHVVPATFRTTRGGTIIHQKTDVDGVVLDLWIASCNYGFNAAHLAREYQNEPQLLDDIKTAVVSQDYFRLKTVINANGGKLKFALNGRPIELEIGKEIFFGAYDSYVAQSNAK